MVFEKFICPECRGAGFIEDPGVKCEMCLGTGYATDDDDTDPMFSYDKGY